MIFHGILGWQQYVPHGHCYLWQRPLVALHGLSDSITALSYFSIPVMLVHFARQRQQSPLRAVSLLFGAFIFACGVGHAFNVWTLWFPTYQVSGVAKAITAFISCLTAIKLWDWMPRLLALRSPQDLEALNQHLEAEIAQRQANQQILKQVLDGTAAATGEAFFRALTDSLGKALLVRQVVIAEIQSHSPCQLSILACYPPSAAANAVVYDAAGTPCEQVLATGRGQHYWCLVQEQFPRAQGLKDMDAQCYLGLPMQDSQGQNLGVIYLCHDQPLNGGSTIYSLLELFASKAATELQRQRAETALQQAHEDLEQRVRDRTAALANANYHWHRLAIQVSTTAAIVRQIRRSLDLSTIFTTTTAELRRALECDRVLVYRFKPDWSGYIVAETVADEWQPCLNKQSDLAQIPWNQHSLRSEHCAIRLHDDGDNSLQDTHLQETEGGIYQLSLDCISVADIYQANFETCYLNLLESLQARAYLTVPIYVGNQLWGLLACYQNSGPRQWDTDLTTPLLADLNI